MKFLDTRLRLGYGLGNKIAICDGKITVAFKNKNKEFYKKVISKSLNEYKIETFFIGKNIADVIILTQENNAFALTNNKEIKII